MKTLLLSLCLGSYAFASTVAQDQADHEKAWAFIQREKRVKQLMRQDQLANEGVVRAAEQRRREAEARAAAILAARRERSEQDGPLSPERKAGAGVVIDKSGIRKLEDSADYTYFSWQARYTNATAAPVKIYAEVRLLDKKGYELDSAVDGAAVLAPGASRVMGGKSITKRALWRQYTSADFRAK